MQPLEAAHGASTKCCANSPVQLLKEVVVGGVQRVDTFAPLSIAAGGSPRRKPKERESLSNLGEATHMMSIHSGYDRE